MVGLATVPSAADLGDAPPAEAFIAAGRGNLEGTEVFQDETGLPCFRTTRSVFGLRGVGSYEGRTVSGGQVVYGAEIAASGTIHGDGPLHVEVENTEPYYHGITGTYGTETGGGAGCNPAASGTPIPAEFRIFAAEGWADTDGDTDVDVLTGSAWVYRVDANGDKVPCRGMGSFARGTPDISDTNKWVAEWTLSEDCTVLGNAAGIPGTGTSPRGTFHTHHGSHSPCFGDFCPNNIKADYEQFLPKPGPYLGLSGPSSAAVGCEKPVTLTARLTVSGWPQANTAVSFAVAGPTPGVPPAGAGTTDEDGKATFTFTAARAGDYTVTATATYNGVQRSATHVVHYQDPPPLSVGLAVPPRGQTEEAATVTATVTDACGPLSGATVAFSTAFPSQGVPWTGQATPPSGSAITDANGQATFSFTGSRAGDYRVTAASTLPSGEHAEATRTVPIEVNTLERRDALAFPPEEPGLDRAMVDPTGRYGYFTGSNQVSKIDLSTFQRVGPVALLTAPDGLIAPIKSVAMDPAGRYAYVGTDYNRVDQGSNQTHRVGAVIKVDLQAMVQVATLDLLEGETKLTTALVDRSGDFAYFGNGGTPGQVIRIDLGSFSRAGSLTLGAGEEDLLASTIDPAGRYAYLGVTDNRNGWVVKIDLATLRRVGSITLAAGEADPVTALMAPSGDAAYFGEQGTPGRVVKIDLGRFERAGAVVFSPDEPIADTSAAVMSPTGDFAYFSSGDRQYNSVTGEFGPAKVVKVDLRSFRRHHAIAMGSGEEQLASGLIDPAGDYAYFGTRNKANTVSTIQPAPDKVVKVRLRRPPNPALAADADAYATDYATPLTIAAPGVLDGDVDNGDGDPLVAGQPTKPAHGTVVLNPNGSFTYTPDTGFAGTDTFTYTASDGMDYSAPATVSIEVAPPPGLTGNAYGFRADVSLFGGPPGSRGPAPTVALASDGADSPRDASVNSAEAVYGPATIFKSGPIDVHAEGALTPRRYATTKATVTGHPDPAERPGPLLYDALVATCTATTAGSSGTMRATNVVVETKYDPDTQEPVEVHPVPASPPPGYTVEGTIDHVGDSFRIVFNEQVASAGGALRSVNAAHMYLLGPIAVGEVVIGHTECGAPPHTGSNTAPSAADDAYTVAGGTTLAVAAPGLLGNDADADADTLTATAAGATPHGSVTVAPDGGFTYTPDPGFSGPDTFTYTATDGFGGADTGLVTVTVGAAGPKVSVGDVSVSEGDAATRAAVFTVSLSKPSTSAVSVAYATANGTATAGSDYTAKSGTLSFAPGATSAKVKVPVAGDT
ncbi:MAG TPA: Ig-like domain-containing protein, partial [Acidimicrobiales bacterium]|nr:Ig-like domain-containing protein [Acidimicrobiales bacterium]